MTTTCRARICSASPVTSKRMQTFVGARGTRHCGLAAARPDADPRESGSGMGLCRLACAFPSALMGVRERRPIISRLRGWGGQRFGSAAWCHGKKGSEGQRNGIGGMSAVGRGFVLSGFCLIVVGRDNGAPATIAPHIILTHFLNPTHQRCTLPPSPSKGRTTHPHRLALQTPRRNPSRCASRLMQSSLSPIARTKPHSA